LKNTLAQYAKEHGGQLRELLWQAHTSRVLSDAIVRYGQLKHTYVVTGWVPVDDLEDLTTRLRSASREILIETLPTTRYGHNSNVPVALINNKFLKPFQMLVNTYARPRYGEIDPTILIAFTFPLLFGAMFGDIGQGLVLFLLGWLLASKKIKALSGMSSLGGVIAAVGAMATIFGFLYGSIFGFEGHLVEEYLGFTLHPLWLSPIDEILRILSFAIDVGIVLLCVGFLLGIFNHFRSKDWAHFIFGHNGIVGFAFYIVFLGLLGSFLSQSPIAPKIAVAIASLPIPFTILAIVFGIAIMFSRLLRNLVEGHRPLIEGGIATFIIQSIMELFETLVSFLSNTLSYVRVGAFAVAHGGLSMAFFSIAGQEPDLGFWITIFIGNIFFVVVEALIVGIQTMRLSYYEFFGKFFTGGGMRFEPLTITPKEEG
jgi:V/A-type H+-transporting ATPase subunit I